MSTPDTPRETGPTTGPTRPAEPAAGLPARPPGDPVDSQATVVHPVPERTRDETLPGSARSAQGEPGTAGAGPAERTTWHPERDPDRTAPAWSTRPVAVRRADSFAAFLLLLAGIAAGVSLLLEWTPGGRTGLDLAQDGVDQLRTDPSTVLDTGLWQPMAVLAGGGLLFLIGLLLLVPARAHRFLGALALLVTLVVVAAVLVPLADARWQLATFDLGFWFALAVAALGLLGALKAALTRKKNS